MEFVKDFFKMLFKYPVKCIMLSTVAVICIPVFSVAGGKYMKPLAMKIFKMFYFVSRGSVETVERMRETFSDVFEEAYYEIKGNPRDSSESGSL